MKQPEILAPAGSEEQLTAAVRCGAHAVYLGTRRFNARNSASNFDGNALGNAVKYCHARGVKVYAAMNTLITDAEIPDFIKEMRTVAESGVDAVILQDAAAAKLWKQYCPEMRLHASTQMTVHNVSGALAAKETGFERIVLARELSLDEIRKIAESTDAEIEVFVHGALCMSVSGTCLLSSMIGGRSGNRGRCAQPCRLDFKREKREYALSLKDLSLLGKLDTLAHAGVSSFKIEGRMKRPEYVAAAVTAAKSAAKGEEYDESALRSVFSRSGFTSGYLDGKRTLDMFGSRTYEDVTAAEPVLKKLRRLYDSENPKIPVYFDFTANNNISSLTVSDGADSVSVVGETPEKAISAPINEEYVKKCLSKTGGTIFYPEGFSFSLGENLSLPSSSINSMRRDALSLLYEKRSKAEPKKFKESPVPIYGKKRKQEKAGVRLRFENINQAFDDERAEKIILPMREILQNPDRALEFSKKLICELPFLVFPRDEDRFLTDLGEIKKSGVKEVSADNIGTFYAAIKAGFTVHGGHGLNILNSLSFGEYESRGASSLTVSPEIAAHSLAEINGNIKKGALGYGYIPLMHMRACPAQTKNGCASCGGLASLKDRQNREFRILCRDKKYSVLLNAVPLYVGDKLPENIDFSVLYFTTEKKEECRAVLDAFLGGESIKGDKTRGLYYRRLL